VSAPDRRYAADMKRLLGIAVVGLTLGPACGMYTRLGQDGYRNLMTPIVKKQAAFDLQCAEDQIEVVQINDVSMGASGCGKRASYVPDNESCSPDQFERSAKSVCTAVIANVASKG
jgi:hypothetical protein